MAEDRHVIPGADGWSVKKEGADRVESVHATQREAVDRARETVREAGGGELVIHTRDGRIRDKDTVFRTAKDPDTKGG